MYNNIKFRVRVEPFKKTHKHGDVEPNFKLRSVPSSPMEDPPPNGEKDHVICEICWKDLTFRAGESKIDLSEKYMPA